MGNSDSHLRTESQRQLQCLAVSERVNIGVMQMIVASLVLLVALLHLGFGRGENATCPTDWIRLQDMCVWISDEELAHWQARDICKENGSQLAYIKDAEENWMLTGALYVLRKQSVWIGLNDLEVPNIFVWADKEPLTYSNFHRGEPAVNGKHLTENCVAMSLARSYEWSSEYCFDHRAFICRKDLQ